MSHNPIAKSPLKSFIEDLAVAEVPFQQIETFIRKHGGNFTADQIEDYIAHDFNLEDAKAYQLALKKQKIRESDENFANGQVALQNSVNIINHLLEQTTNRWKLLLEQKESGPSSIREKDILGYITQIRETAKVVHELNSQLKDDNFIPIHVFYEEIEKFIGLVINFLIERERDIPGLDLKNQFLLLIKDKYKQLEVGTVAQVEASVEAVE